MTRDVAVVLDRPRTLRYDLGALDRLAKALGNGTRLPFEDILKLELGDIRVLTTAVWAGLTDRDFASPEDVAAVLFLEDIGRVAEAVTAALLASAGTTNGTGASEEANPPTSGSVGPTSTTLVSVPSVFDPASFGASPSAS